ncbi:MAG: protease inhibitor I42 family protein [Myxococcota bacterium]
MAKAKAGAKKAKPAPKKSSARRVASRPARTKKAAKSAPKLAKPVPKGKAKPESKPVDLRPKAKDPLFFGPLPDKPMPRATKPPAPGAPLTKREMEQILTAGAGRGVFGEGSLKGRLGVREGFPYLYVVGRDKRELVFLLQGPDQEVLPAYLEHKVSVSGLIKKTSNYGGTVDVRKYTAKKPDEVVPEAPQEEKLKYLSPGEVEQLCSAGMGAGMKGFAALRGNLEMTGDKFFLVVSNGGTRQQVSFLLEGKGAKGLRKHLGQIVQVSGVTAKSSGWGGSVEVETVEPRPAEHKAVSRDAMELVHVEGSGHQGAAEVKMNQGLTVRLQERANYTWAIEPTTAKRIGLREANFEPGNGGAATREFFFTPRNPGLFDVEFFLAKALSPAQVAKTYKLAVNVKV